MLKYMLDTNIAIYVIKRRPPEALATFNQHAGQLCISSITLAELMHGAEKSAKPDHNLRQVEDFTSRLTVLEYGNKAAAHLRLDSRRRRRKRFLPGSSAPEQSGSLTCVLIMSLSWRVS